MRGPHAMLQEQTRGLSTRTTQTEPSRMASQARIKTYGNRQRRLARLLVYR
jgi:hypothetical protein